MKKTIILSLIIVFCFIVFCGKSPTKQENEMDISNPVKGKWRGRCDKNLGQGVIVLRTFYFHFNEDKTYWLRVVATLDDEPAPDYELEETGRYVLQQNTIKLITDVTNYVRNGIFSVGPWNMSLEFFDFGEMVLRRYVP